MSLQPHEQTVLDLLSEADGKIRTTSLAQRVKHRLFPGSCRTAGVVKLTEEALKVLVCAGLAARDDGDVVHVTAEGRR